MPACQIQSVRPGVSPLQRHARRAWVEEALLDGVRPNSLVEQGVERFTVDERTIRRDIAIVLRSWRQETAERMRAKRARILRQLERLAVDSRKTDGWLHLATLSRMASILGLGGGGQGRRYGGEPADVPAIASVVDVARALRARREAAAMLPDAVEVSAEVEAVRNGNGHAAANGSNGAVHGHRP